MSARVNVHCAMIHVVTKKYSGLTKGNDTALEALKVKRLSDGEVSKMYRIRGPEWLHKVLAYVSDNGAVQGNISKAEALGNYLVKQIKEED